LGGKEPLAGEKSPIRAGNGKNTGISPEKMVNCLIITSQFIKEAQHFKEVEEQVRILSIKTKYK
jgi:hypothetical protein